jgi:regulator of sigma E protease
MMYVLSTLILLGILIFVHELGHFVVARAFGVKVETFSLGFGPKILFKKWRGTVFAISLIPLGGYVKMYGDEFGKDVPHSEKSKAYLTQSPIKKIGIALAGPTANVLFTFFLFCVLGIIGQEHLEPRLGTIFEGTFAHQVGFRSQDTILSINGEPVETGTDVLKALKHRPSAILTFSIQRPGNDPFDLTTQTSQQIGINEFGQEVQEGFIQGLDLFLHPAMIEVVGPPAWAHDAGLEDGDKIISVRGQPVHSVNQILPYLRTSGSETLCPLTVLRGQASIELSAPCPTSGTSSVESLLSLGLAPGELKVGQVKPRSPAESADLRKGDVILRVDGKAITHFSEFRDQVQTYGEAAKPMRIEIDRGGVPVEIEVTPTRWSEKEESQPWHTKNFPYAIGFSPHLALEPQKTLVRLTQPAAILMAGVSQTWEWTEKFAVGFWKLLSGELSLKMLSGPIYIGKIAGDWFQEGLRQFLFLMAMISLNLGLINLVPIPILDGGHILFFVIEMMIRRPLNAKWVERAYQVGFVLIVLLTLFVIYNDLLKVIK